MKERPYPFGGAKFIPNSTIVTDENSVVLSIHRIAEEKAVYETHVEEESDDENSN